MSEAIDKDKNYLFIVERTTPERKLHWNRSRPYHRLGNAKAAYNRYSKYNIGAYQIVAYEISKEGIVVCPSPN